MTAVYTPSSLSEIRYGVVQITTGSVSLTLPHPQQVPEVDPTDVPDRHKFRTSSTGDLQIVVRHTTEDDPLPNANVDWLDDQEARSHLADNPDVWG